MRLLWKPQIDFKQEAHLFLINFAAGELIMQIGLCTPSKNIEKVKQIGYDYIELSGNEIMAMPEREFEALALRRAKLNYPVMGFNAYCNEKTPIVGDGFQAERARSYAAAICERGARLGIRFLDVGAPAARRLPIGYDKAKADLQCKKFLEVTAKEAEKYHIDVLFEALHNKCCNYVNYTVESLRLVREMDIENLKINLDFYHMEIMKESLENLSDVMPYVRHLHYNHISAGKLDREFIIPEDIPVLMKIKNILDDCGYDGTFSVEPDDTPAFDEVAPVSYKVMRTVFSEN